MIAEELIRVLQRLPADTEIQVWDPYYDRQTSEVHVCKGVDANIALITKTNFGNELTP